MTIQHDSAAVDVLHIEPVGEHELDTLCRLIADFAAFQGAEDAVSATPELLRRYILNEDKQAEALMLRQGDKSVGYCIYFYAFSSFLSRPVLFVEDVYLEPGAQKRGYGRQVFEYLRDRARERGCARLEWCVMARNRNAVDFYQHLGANMVPGMQHFRWPIH